MQIQLGLPGKPASASMRGTALTYRKPLPSKTTYLTLFRTLPQYSADSVCMIWMTSKLASR